MSVSVLVPYRPESPERAQAWAWVAGWWADIHPEWQIVTGTCEGPWVKAHAVGDALARADGDVLVIADADVVCAGVAEAVAVVRAGAAWAIPHHRVYRLGDAASQRVYAGHPVDKAACRPGSLARAPYIGVEGGGMVVLRRATYERIPLDPRFAGWGGEDLSWGLALRTLTSPPWRGVAPLWHLHHRPAPRLNAHVGNPASHALHVRYQYAARHPAVMAALIAEYVDSPSPTRGAGRGAAFAPAPARTPPTWRR